MPGMTVSPEEVARFDALAGQWWDPEGPMRPLHRMNPVRVAWIVQRMSRPGHDSGAILDIGCGISAQAGMFREFRYVGADLNLVRLKRAHAVNRWAAYAVEDITRMGWRDHSFAAVVCLEVIEHVPEAFRLAVLRELLRVVQPDGLLILSTPNGRITVWKRLLGLKCERSHERELSTGEVQGLIEGAGATLHRVETIDNLVLPASRVAAGVIHLAAGWPALRRRLQSLATKAGYETLLYVASPRPVGVGAVGHRKESA